MLLESSSTADEISDCEATDDGIFRTTEDDDNCSDST